MNMRLSKDVIRQLQKKYKKKLGTRVGDSASMRKQLMKGAKVSGYMAKDGGYIAKKRKKLVKKRKK
jgi:ABC-type molybdate transport system substrate-binding protein